jgi:hypothetical protein
MISESDGVPQANPRPQKLLPTTHRPSQARVKPHRPHHPALLRHHPFHVAVPARDRDSLGNDGGFVSQRAPRIIRSPCGLATYVLGFVSQQSCMRVKRSKAGTLFRSGNRPEIERPAAKALLESPRGDATAAGVDRVCPVPFASASGSWLLLRYLRDLLFKSGFAT